MIAMTIPNISKETQISTNIGVIIAILLFGIWIATYISGYDKRISLIEQKQLQQEQTMKAMDNKLDKILDILISNKR
jgi:hypothetical protein